MRDNADLRAVPGRGHKHHGRYICPALGLDEVDFADLGARRRKRQAMLDLDQPPPRGLYSQLAADRDRPP